MGLLDYKCDSCGEEADVLFPIAILDEMPTGGMQMVLRYYCIECKETIEGEAEEAEDKKKDERRVYDCGCVYFPYSRNPIKMFWERTGDCNKHWEDKDKIIENYPCGCKIVRSGSFYLYKNVCEDHE